MRALLCFLTVWVALLGWSARALALGEPCSLDSECSSGFCVEGVCCDSACTGQCETCLGAPVGQCRAVPAGQVRPSQPCSTDFGECGGACDGTQRDSCVYPEGPKGVCSGNRNCIKGKESQNACSLGACVVEETECGLYRCGSNACLTSCETRDDCIPGSQCVAGTCEPASEPVCIDEYTTLAPNGVASACGGYPCDAETGACATGCKADDECVGEGTLCRGGKCIPAANIRRVGLYDPEACSCRSVGAGAPGGIALAGWFVAALVLTRRRRRLQLGSVSLTGVVVVALLACGDPQEELPADEVCVDVGYSIANRTESCTDDPELASERWTHYEERFDCNVGKVTDEIRELYVCPVELLRMECDVFLDYGDDLEGLLSSIPECTRVVKRKDGTLLAPTELDAGADANLGASDSGAGDSGASDSGAQDGGSQ